MTSLNYYFYVKVPKFYLVTCQFDFKYEMLFSAVLLLRSTHKSYDVDAANMPKSSNAIALTISH